MDGGTRLFAMVYYKTDPVNIMTDSNTSTNVITADQDHIAPDETRVGENN